MDGAERTEVIDKSAEGFPAWPPATPYEPISSSTDSSLKPRRPFKAVLIASLLSALLGGAIGTATTLAIQDDGNSSGVLVERVTRPSTTSSSAGAPAGVSAVAKRVSPSIVLINASSGQGALGRRTSATGSGVIFTADGYILTNNHVVESARTIEITLTTGEKLAGKVVGTAAPVDDLAVIKVDGKDLPAATLGSTADLQPGDLAVAVGSPFGLQGSVTAGVISALHRNIDLGEGARLTDAIQTDAPINPGNSGGALADSGGRVIGINTAIVGSQVSSGVGFAIPIDIARRDAEQIIRTGKAERPFLGISGESVPSGGGALVQDVTAGSPADRAGIQTGDIITELAGTKTESMEELIAVLSKLETGKKASLTVKRGNDTRKLEVELSPVAGE